LESLKETDHSEDLSINGRITLKTELREIGVWGCGLDSYGLGYGPMAGSWAHDNESSGSTNDVEFTD
jgi:hypothetical protein